MATTNTPLTQNRPHTRWLGSTPQCLVPSSGNNSPPVNIAQIDKMKVATEQNVQARVERTDQVEFATMTSR